MLTREEGTQAGHLHKLPAQYEMPNTVIEFHYIVVIILADFKASCNRNEKSNGISQPKKKKLQNECSRR